MVTIRAATLILVALVGCGPKPPAARYQVEGMTSMDFNCSMGRTCIQDEKGRVVWSGTSQSEADAYWAKMQEKPPPIDANPYRFTEGEWGEGWPKPPCSMVGYDDGQIRMLIKNCDALNDLKLKDYSLDNY